MKRNKELSAGDPKSKFIIAHINKRVMDWEDTLATTVDNDIVGLHISWLTKQSIEKELESSKYLFHIEEEELMDSYMHDDEDKYAI